jgi:hypothetical protein
MGDSMDVRPFLILSGDLLNLPSNMDPSPGHIIVTFLPLAGALGGPSSVFLVRVTVMLRSSAYFIISDCNFKSRSFSCLSAFHF